jgi:hypothetical protein
MSSPFASGVSSNTAAASIALRGHPILVGSFSWISTVNCTVTIRPLDKRNLRQKFPRLIMTGANLEGLSFMVIMPDGSPLVIRELPSSQLYSFKWQAR